MEAAVLCGTVSGQEWVAIGLPCTHIEHAGKQWVREASQTAEGGHVTASKRVRWLAHPWTQTRPCRTTPASCFCCTAQNGSAAWPAAREGRYDSMRRGPPAPTAALRGGNGGRHGWAEAQPGTVREAGIAQERLKASSSSHVEVVAPVVAVPEGVVVLDVVQRVVDVLDCRQGSGRSAGAWVGGTWAPAEQARGRQRYNSSCATAGGQTHCPRPCCCCTSKGTSG